LDEVEQNIVIIQWRADQPGALWAPEKIDLTLSATEKEKQIRFHSAYVP